jgi:hypothetical protein
MAFLDTVANKLGGPGRLVERLIAWSAKVMADRDGTPTVKRFAYAYMVGICGGSITGIVGALIWAVTQLQDAQLIEGMKVLNDTLVWFGNPVVAAVLGGYLGGKAIERSKDKAAEPGGGSDGGDQA